MRRVLASVVLVGVLLGACVDQSDTAGDERRSTRTVGDPARPFTLVTPASYHDDTPMPLIVLLHGLGGSGDIVESYFHLEPLAESRGFLLALPDGTRHPSGDRFWDATDACCGFGETADDVGYLTSVIDDVSASRNVDPSRVFVVGHSNGGFMSYRMACDAADHVAAVVSLAGATWLDPSRCSPSQPVSVLQIHGNADDTIKFDGEVSSDFGSYPGAVGSITTWAGYDGCAGSLAGDGETMDLDSRLDGVETMVSRFDGCPAGIGVELWTVVGGSHVPDIGFDDGSRPMSDRIIDWLFAHPKPPTV